jgi:hypothetical protein
VKISLRGPRIRIELDDNLLFEWTNDFSRKGSAQLRGSDCAVRFRNIKVAAPDGTKLLGRPSRPLRFSRSELTPDFLVSVRSTPRNHAIFEASFVTAGTVNRWMIIDTKGISSVIPVLNRMRWTNGPRWSFIRSTSS